MARTKQKKSINSEVALIDEIYVETDDLLRGILLEASEAEEKIAHLQHIIKEEENKRDPNRNVFHVAGLAEFEAAADEAKRQLFIEEENKKQIDEKISKIESRLDLLHKVRKILYKIENPDPQPEEVVVETVERVDYSPTVIETLKEDCLPKLNMATDKLELSNRFVTFDPERSRLEMISATDYLKETIETLSKLTVKSGE